MKAFFITKVYLYAIKSAFFSKKSEIVAIIFAIRFLYGIDNTVDFKLTYKQMLLKGPTTICLLLFYPAWVLGQLSIFDRVVQDVDCAHEKGSINITVKGGKAPYTYQWSNGTFIEDAIDLEPGRYFLTVTDAQQPPETIGVDFWVKYDTIRPIANAGPDHVLSCAQQTILLSGSASSKASWYSWESSDGYVRPAPGYTDAVAHAPGTYILTARNRNGCIDYDTVLVTRTSDMPISYAGDTIIRFCQDRYAELDGGKSSLGPNYIYEWFGVGAAIDEGKYSIKAKTNTPAKYYLKVTDTLRNCSSISSVWVVDDKQNPIVVIPGATRYLNCEKDTVQLEALAKPDGLLFEWALWGGKGHIVSGQNTSTIVADQPGSYIVKVTNPLNGCTSTHFMGADTFYMQPSAYAGKDVAVGCDGDVSVTLTANLPTHSFTHLYWYNSTGVHLNPFLDRSVTVNQSGLYILKAINTVGGCYDLDTVYLFGDDLLKQIKVSEDTLTCLLKEVTLDGSLSIASGGVQYNWFTQNGHFVEVSTTSNIKVDSTGTYRLVVKTGGCSDTAYVQIFSNYKKPFIELPSPNFLPCNPPSLFLKGKVPTGRNYIYKWNTQNGQIVTGGQSGVVTVSKAGIYSLTLTDAQNGCTDTFGVIVDTIAQPVLDFVVSDAICHGTPTGTVEGLAPSGLHWSLDGDTGDGDGYFSDLLAGEYWLKGSDSVGCTAAKKVIINQPELPFLSLGADFSLLRGRDTMLAFETDLDRSALHNIVWSLDGKSLDCLNCQFLSIKPQITSTYQILLTDTLGCQITDSIKVFIEKTGLYVPNIFAPDLKDENSRFMPTSNDKDAQILRWSVYDRWGNLVFKMPYPSPVASIDGWDGSTKGKTLPAGVYTWILEWQVPGKAPVIETGDVLLVR